VKNDISNLTDIEIYKLVLSGKLKQFPLCFWEKPNSLQSAKEITIYLFEEILKWSNEDILNNLCQKNFKENKLGGMIAALFDWSVFRAIDNAYPGKFKEWEIRNTPRNFWNTTTAKEALKWVLEEKLKYTDKEILKNLNYTFFKDNKLISPVLLFNKSWFSYFNYVYPNRFKNWEFQQVENGYWTKETRVEATKWLIDALKINLSDDVIITKKHFEDNNLSNLLHCYNGSPYNALLEAYPDKNWDYIMERNIKNGYSRGGKIEII